MRLVLVGPPGAGKGTQAEFIAAHLSVPKISTGDIFRANVSQGTPLGVEAKRYMDAGELVPDEVTINMVRGPAGRARRRRRASCSTASRAPTPQAAALDKLLADLGTALDLVLELVVDDDEVIRRLSGRRTCRGCGKIWHVEFDAASREDICDRCGAELFQRDDDKAGDDRRAAAGVRATRPRRWSTTTAPRASWSASTPPGRSRTSPSGPSTPCGRTAAESAGQADRDATRRAPLIGDER